VGRKREKDKAITISPEVGTSLNLDKVVAAFLSSLSL